LEALTLLLLWLLADPAAQAAGQAGTASGSVTLNGRTARLAYAYASAAPGMFDKTSEDTRILLSDVPLPDATRADVFDLVALGRTGRATVVEVLINSSGAIISGAFHAAEFKGMVSATGMHVFTPRDVTRTAISGRLATTPGVHEFMGVRFSYDATFSAPIPRALTDVEREASLKSPTALAAGAHLAAIVAGNLPAFLTTLSREASVAYRRADAATRFAQLRADFPPDSRVVELVPQVDGAVLAKTEGHEGGLAIGNTIRLVLEGGLWKAAERP
jgi:hypothetical protein